MNIKKHHSFSLLLGLFLILTLSACSNTKTSKGVVKDVQLGTVIAVNKRITQPEQQKPRGNVGVTGNTINLTTAVGIEEVFLDNNHLGIQNVYPNPFTTELNIEFYSEGKGDAKIAIHNLIGQVVASHTDTWAEGNHKFIYTILS